MKDNGELEISEDALHALDDGPEMADVFEDAPPEDDDDDDQPRPVLSEPCTSASVNGAHRAGAPQPEPMELDDGPRTSDGEEPQQQEPMDLQDHEAMEIDNAVAQDANSHDGEQQSKHPEPMIQVGLVVDSFLQFKSRY